MDRIYWRQRAVEHDFNIFKIRTGVAVKCNANIIHFRWTLDVFKLK